jgi:hypothetical protein
VNNDVKGVLLEKDANATQRQELLNRYEFCTGFLRRGFVPYVPEFDPGVDFMLYREADDLLFKVQMKATWTVREDYMGKRMWIAFGDEYSAKRSCWYFMPHDLMVHFGKPKHGDSPSWRKGEYSYSKSTSSLLINCQDFRLPALFTILSKDRVEEWYQASEKNWL